MKNAIKILLYPLKCYLFHESQVMVINKMLHYKTSRFFLRSSEKVNNARRVEAQKHIKKHKNKKREKTKVNKTKVKTTTKENYQMHES